jgi:hypothetical protein
VVFCANAALDIPSINVSTTKANAVFLNMVGPLLF